MNTWIEIAATLEQTINHVMDEAYPFSWNEDYLSYQLLHEIHGCLSSRPYLRGSEHVRVSMECYKLVGKQETTFGDIGLLITVARKGSPPLTGAAYLEAKRRKKMTTQFPESKTSQAKRILKHAPKAALLLYDYEFSTEFIGPLGYELWTWNDLPAITRSVPMRPVVKVRTVPLTTALATQMKDTRLYPYSTPFSIQLMARYFCGLDLEFSTECIQSLMGRGGRFIPKRLAMINVVEEGAAATDMPPIDPQVFSRELEYKQGRP